MENEAPFLVFHYPEVDSTNRVARRFAGQPDVGWAFVSADRQTAGKGRYQRRWESPKNMGLWASLFCRPAIEPRQINLFGMALAIAIRDFLAALLGPNSRSHIRLKWPNDVLIDSRKCCGILLEGQVSQNEVGFLVAGFGINMNQNWDDFPEELRQSAISLKMISGLQYDIAKIRQEIFAYLFQQIQWEIENRFADTVNDFLLNMVGLGEEVRLSLPYREVQGICKGLDEQGFLILKTENGRELISAGDLWILNRR